MRALDRFGVLGLCIPPLVVVALAASAYICGRLLVSRFSFRDAAERAFVATALGLAVFGQAALLLAQVGRLQISSVLLALAALHLLGRQLWRQVPGELREAAAALRGSLGGSPLSVLLGGVAVGVTALLLIVLPLYPPTAFDATLYHLPFVRAFMATSAAPFLPDLRVPIFPQLAEMLMTVAALFGGDLSIQCLAALAVLLTAGFVALWTRQAFAGSGNGAAGAALFLGNPIIVALATSAYVEAFLALWTTGLFYALHRWRNGAGRRWLALAGAFAGCAAATKYLGLLVLGLGGLVVLLGRAPAGPRRRWINAGLYAAFALLAAGVWYRRIAAATGNPLFPYLAHVFGPSAYSVDPVAPDYGSLAGLGWQAWLIGVLRLPLDLVFGRGRLGLVVPWSPFFLVGVPLLVLGAWRRVAVRHLLGLAAVYCLVMTLMPSDVRYLAPVIPLLSIALIGAVAATWPQFMASALWRRALVVALLLPGWAFGVWELVRQGPPPVSTAAREAYLARHLPLYPAVAALNRTLGAGYTLYAFGAENLVYYADGRLLGDVVGPARYGLIPDPAVADPAVLAQALRRVEADHLLLPATPAFLRGSSQPAFRRHFSLIYRDAAARVFTLLPE